MIYNFLGVDNYISFFTEPHSLRSGLIVASNCMAILYPNLFGISILFQTFYEFQLFIHIFGGDFMRNSQEVAKIIKLLAKSKNISIGKMLEDCEVSKNALSTMLSGGHLPRTENLVKIADYLDCSVDYLLGRVDTPNGTYSINNNTNINGTQNNVINGNVPSDCSDDKMLLEMIKELDIIDRSKIIIQIDEMKNKK